MMGIDFAHDQVARFELREGCGHITAVDAGVSAEVGLTGGPPLLECGEQSVVISAQSVAMCGKPASQ